MLKIPNKHGPLPNDCNFSTIEDSVDIEVRLSCFASLHKRTKYLLY